MNITDIFKLPSISVETTLTFLMHVDVPVLGKKELVELRVDGFKDDDDDGDIEVIIDLEFMDGAVLDVERQEIELPTSLVRNAVLGQGDGVSELFAFISEALKSAGIKIPF